jgi:rhodanese-related sulfurtransferase
LRKEKFIFSWRYEHSYKFSERATCLYVITSESDGRPADFIEATPARRSNIQDPSMTALSVTPSQVRLALLLREEIALLDLRHEAAYATGHPLFAANMASDRITLEAETRLPRRDVPVVVYDAGEGLVALAADQLMALGYTNIRHLDGGLQAWQMAGYELFQDVNSYAKAFGELVESRRHTPSLSADEVATLIATNANIRILDVRRFDEYATMNIPGSVSVPGAELVLRAGRAAPDPETTIIVNCAGRTRSIIGTQSLINAGVPNKVLALRNGTIGWTLAKQDLEHGADRRGGIGVFEGAKANAREVAYRAGVRHVSAEQANALQAQRNRTLYRFDVRASEDYAAGHIGGFRHYPGGQLVQEIDMAAPVRGARILLTDDMGLRADMTASWLAQMGWETYVLDGGYDGALEVAPPKVLPKPDPSHRYRRPYEGNDVATGAMQAYLDWEYGLVEQLRRDETHGFFVI